MAERGPDLLPVDDKMVAVNYGARTKSRQIRTRHRFREALAPDLLAREDSGQVAALLILSAVLENRRPAHRKTQLVERRRCAHARHLLVEDRALDHRGALAA